MSVRSPSSIAIIRTSSDRQIPEMPVRWGWWMFFIRSSDRTSTSPIPSPRGMNLMATWTPPGPIAFQTSP